MSLPPSTGPALPRRREILALLFALAFLNYLDRNLLFPLLSLIGRDLHLSEAQQGMLATGFHVVYAASAPLLGFFADRLSRRQILLASLLGWSTVTALSGAAVGFYSLLLLRSLTGLGEGGYFPTALSLIGDLYGPHERGRVIALHGVCATLGGSAGYALGGVLGAHLGWRLPFLLTVAPGLLLALLVWRRLEEPPRGSATTGASATEPSTSPATALRRPYLAIVASPAVLLMALAAASAAFAMNALNTFFPSYLEEAHRFSVASAGTLTGVFFAATLIGQLVGGASSDLLARRSRVARPLLVGAAYALSAVGVAALAGTPSVGLALGAYGLTQAGRGFAEPNIFGSVLDALPAGERGTAQGFLLMLTFAGASASPPLVGHLKRRGGYPLAFGCAAVAAALTSVLAFALAAWRRAGRPVEQGGSST
ncbi:MAG: MFS transporter [Deltaproteobacteria bacterium]|nr:MFS transporter [Deltaproteobacteria bacterium]